MKRRFQCLALAACLAVAAARDLAGQSSVDETPNAGAIIPASEHVLTLARSDTAIQRIAATLRSYLLATESRISASDTTARRTVLMDLVTVDVLEGANLEGLSRVAEARQLTANPRQRPFVGFFESVLFRARAAKPTSEIIPPPDDFRRELRTALDSMSWSYSEGRVKQMVGNWTVAGPAFLAAELLERAEPERARSGALSRSAAASLMFARAREKIFLPLRHVILEELFAYVRRHEAEKPNIWLERAVRLPANRTLHPVAVAVWDGGVDVEQFRTRLPQSRTEVLDDRDDDRNGFVDDVHGVVIDGHFETGSANLLAPWRGATLSSDEAGLLFAGQQDALHAIDSPERQRLQEFFSAESPEGITRVRADLGEFANWAHGTFVASVLLESSPNAQLYVVRDNTWDATTAARPPAVETSRRRVAAWAKTVAAMKAAGVRAVNMSWTLYTPQEHEAMLASSIGSADERRMIARETFEIERDGLREIMLGSPEILFVTVAGNRGRDVGSGDWMPAGLRLPNLLVVGGTDKAGGLGFTNYGNTVSVYAEGEASLGILPEGRRAVWTGTSTAAPRVTGLAALLFGLDPTLTPQNVADLIRDTATPDSEGRRLLHPQRAVERVLSTRSEVCLRSSTFSQEVA